MVSQAPSPRLQTALSTAPGSVLRRTFLQVPGIGPAAERALWRAGYTDWSAALAAAVAGRLRPALAARLAAHLPAAEAALAAGDAGHFSALARYGESWRLYGGFAARCLYLDIETNGAAGDEEEITLVGVSDGERYEAFLAEENLDDLPDWLEACGAQLLVTFNGAGFDVPALRRRWGRRMSGSALPPVHIDLRFTAPKAGLKGGLKRVEQALGLERPPTVRGLDGWDAVRLWWAWRNDGDRAARDRLLAYNRCDVLHLMPLLAHVHATLAATCGAA
ncbi:MAG: ribonuclease H-like domain-containing protein [Terriglobales bacterium]